MKRPIFILGKNSFVAKAFFAQLKDRENARLLSREEIDFLDDGSFSNVNFGGSIVVDFVNVNNGNEQEIMDCNYTGFCNFCRHLIEQASDITYVYVSTISVLSKEHAAASAYVRSKKMAEEFLMQSGLNYHIFRLSYPVGKGENKLRMVSRLIENLKAGKELSINNYLVNLNEVNDIARDICQNLLARPITFVSNNIYLPLAEVALLLKDGLHSTSPVTVKDVSYQFTPLSDTPFVPAQPVKSVLLEML